MAERRELKFRLLKDGKIVGYERWNKLRGKWLYIIIYASGKSCPTDFVPHDAKEQFINRYDKHGKEIYEGDELDGGFNALCGGDVFWDDEGLAFYTCNYHAQALPIRDTSGTEITGNIHD